MSHAPVLQVSRVIERAYKNFGVFGGEKLDLVPTGIECLDRNMGGILPGALYFVGARTNVGKSTLMLNMACAAAMTGRTAIYISGEDPEALIGGKIQSRWSSIPLIELARNGHALGSAHGIKRALEESKKLPLYMVFPHVRTLIAMQKLLFDLRAEHKPSVVYFDYLTTMRPDQKKDLRVFYSEAIMMLREFALSTEIPVIVGSQVTRRSGELSDNYEISLRELAETGNIENYADLILLLWSDDEGQRIIKVAKNKISGVYRPYIRCHFDPNTELLTTEEILQP